MKTSSIATGPHFLSFTVHRLPLAILVTHPTLIAVPHLMRRSLFWYPLVPEVAVVFKLTFVQILEYALLFLCSPLHTFVKLVFGGVLNLLLPGFVRPVLLHFWTVHFLLYARVAGVGKLLGPHADGTQY